MAYESKLKIRIKLKQLKPILIFLSIIFLLGLYYTLLPKPIYETSYKGTKIMFRADLREAKKIPVYPNEEILRRSLIHPLVKNVTIAFVPVENENDIYVVNAWEIVMKLYLAYEEIGIKPKFNGMNISSYENIELYGKIQNPLIVLIHPKYANETAVRVEDHTILISGKTKHELDLATVKFLIVSLRIKV